MSMRKLIFTFLFGASALSMSAQDAAPYRSFSPADQWELGVHLGMPFVNGDISPKLPGYGGGLHVRKSLDHLFSVRAGALFGKGFNENTKDTRSSDISWVSGNAELVLALNNLIWDKPNRKFLLNGFVGLGAVNYTTNYKNVVVSGSTATEGEVSNTASFMNGGFGLAYRLSPKVNIGLEYTIYSVFGRPGDLLDADENISSGTSSTTYRDNMNYPHLTINFNLGGKDKVTGQPKPEPRYWVNPLDGVAKAISDLEARPIYNNTDTDGDGIIDDIDQEDNSPAGARVDTKGVTLDSDGDKVPDYKDKEPYSAPGYKVDAMGVAQVPKPNFVTEEDVNRIVDAKLANFKLPSSSVADWFLPMVNFDANSYTVKKSEYEKLYQVAQVLKSNTGLKLVVSGNTDRTSSEKYNNVLSYNRANAVIAHLTSQHGIARERLVLDWAGEGNSIINTNGANATNRRVEFRGAKAGDADKARPEGKAGTGSIEGNKSGF